MPSDDKLGLFDMRTDVNLKYEGPVMLSLVR